jgi:hypothetical protein
MARTAETDDVLEAKVQGSKLGVRYVDNVRIFGKWGYWQVICDSRICEVKF